MKAMPESQEADSSFCVSFQTAIELIGKRWNGAILAVLLDGARRLSELVTTVPGLSERLLAERATEWGGTCLNWGCIPTKALIQSAEVLQAVQRAGDFGVRVGEPEVDWPAMQARKDEVVARLRSGVEALLRANGVEMITAR